MNTGHDDDVQFGPASDKEYLPGVSIFSLYGKPHDRDSSNFYGRDRVPEPLILSFQ